LRVEDSSIPSAKFIHLLETCSNELGTPDFGMRLGYESGPDVLGPVALIAKHCATGEEAMAAIIKYLHVSLPAIKLSLESYNSEAKGLIFELIETDVGPSQQFMEWALGLSLRHLQLLATPSATPYSIHLTSRPLLPMSYYNRFFGCPVFFEQNFTCMAVKNTDLSRSMRMSDSQTKKVLSDYAENYSSLDTSSFEEQIRDTIRSLLPTGRCKISVVAEQYSMGMRTMQRKLKDEGLVFSDLIDGVRKTLAKDYLQSKSYTFQQVASLLGYTEQSTLSHACRRWFGDSPRVLRSKWQQ
jgi:AraC-like DNA-binding protein